MGGNLVRLGFFMIVAGVGSFVCYYLDLFGERLPTDNERGLSITSYGLTAVGTALIVVGAVMVAGEALPRRRA